MPVESVKRRDGDDERAQETSLYSLYSATRSLSLPVVVGATIRFIHFSITVGSFTIMESAATVCRNRLLRRYGSTNQTQLDRHNITPSPHKSEKSNKLHFTTPQLPSLHKQQS
mmetsp:Transcript_23879/g.51685  ORF Transcript_23879/g.51685 Transcript_23879/m.51685 type:complete len:113 (-) Transcript_23879:325-663(-)